MPTNRKQVLHVRSNQTNYDGSPKLPTSDDIVYGEIAINYATGKEAISIKNSTNNIVAFGKEVVVGSTAPEQGCLAEIFIDESVDPMSVDVYSKQQIDTKVAALNSEDEEIKKSVDSKVSRGNETTFSASQLLVDESASNSIEVYTRQEVDALFAKLIQLNPSLVWN